MLMTRKSLFAGIGTLLAALPLLGTSAKPKIEAGSITQHIHFHTNAPLKMRQIERAARALQREFGGSIQVSAHDSKANHTTHLSVS
jgi:hypothetical protein